jgi:hypothetical protein
MDFRDLNISFDDSESHQSFLDKNRNTNQYSVFFLLYLHPLPIMIFKSSYYE